jgi:hypothetical protein
MAAAARRDPARGPVGVRAAMVQLLDSFGVLVREVVRFGVRDRRGQQLAEPGKAQPSEASVRKGPPQAWLDYVAASNPVWVSGAELAGFSAADRDSQPEQSRSGNLQDSAPDPVVDQQRGEDERRQSSQESGRVRRPLPSPVTAVRWLAERIPGVAAPTVVPAVAPRHGQLTAGEPTGSESDGRDQPAVRPAQQAFPPGQRAVRPGQQAVRPAKPADAQPANRLVPTERWEREPDGSRASRPRSSAVARSRLVRVEPTVRASVPAHQPAGPAANRPDGSATASWPSRDWTAQPEPAQPATSQTAWPNNFGADRIDGYEPLVRQGRSTTTAREPAGPPRSGGNEPTDRWPQLFDPSAVVENPRVESAGGVARIWELLEQDRVDPTMTAQRRK